MTSRGSGSTPVEQFIRIFSPTPDAGLIAVGEKIVRGLRRRILRKKDVFELITIACGTCQVFLNPPSIPATLAQLIESEMKKHSSSFVRGERDLELAVYAAAAVVDVISHSTSVRLRGGWGVADVLAASLWSSLSFLPSCDGAKLETLRRRVVRTARDRLLKSGVRARDRESVPSVGTICEDEDPEGCLSAARQAVDVLLRNAAFDREEIDVLHWVLSGLGVLPGLRLDSLSSEVRAVTAGVEMGAFMRAAPTHRHRDYTVRGLSEEPYLCLSQLLEAVSEYRMKIVVSFEVAAIDDVPLVFPVLSGLASGEPIGPGADLPRSLSEWGSRALLERSLLGTCLKEIQT